MTSMAQSITGEVFDIQLFSIHDGPGIRTTVFLKGCPFRCRWCHNPEAWTREPSLSYSAACCIACRACVEVCPNDVHSFPDGVHTLDRQKCTVCGRCADACPATALEVAGRTMTVDEVMARVSRDLEFYKNSGGGMTLSGGEPFYQLEFSLALLAAAKQQQIHTAVETCGAWPSAQTFRLVDVIDLFLFDIKAGAEQHPALVGSPADLPLANLRLLQQQGARVVVRAVMVPGVNNTPAFLRQLAELARQFPGIGRFELLPYHTLGRQKLLRFGLPDDELPAKPPTDAEMASYRSQLIALEPSLEERLLVHPVPL